MNTSCLDLLQRARFLSSVSAAAHRRANDNEDDDDSEAGGQLSNMSEISFRDELSNDFMVIRLRNVKVMRATQHFLTSKVILKLQMTLAKDFALYKLVLHDDGCGVDLHYPCLPLLDLEGVNDMCSQDFQMLDHVDKSVAVLDQMKNQYNALFTKVRQHGAKAVKKKSYRFEEGTECSPEFFNNDPSSRTLDPNLTKTKQLVHEYLEGNETKQIHQVVWYINWQLSVVEDTHALAEAAAAAAMNPLVGALSRATIRDDAMQG
jgi:hypothetical protein